MKALKIKFECPACGNVFCTNPCILTDISTLKATAKEPNRCSCGRRKDFKIIDVELLELEAKSKE